MKPVVEEDGNDEICEAHARKNQTGECAERPERHLELAFRLFCVLEGKHEANGGNDQSDSCQDAEDDEE